jgi:uncharacterized membrane protein
LIEVKDEKSRQVITCARFQLIGGAMHAQEVAPNVRGAPAVVGGIKVERVAFDAPWAWLAAGWRDLWVAPRISLAYGAVFAAVSMGLTLALKAGGLEALVLSLGGGFLLIGPIAAIGLYETSRRIEAGQSLTLRDIARAAFRAPGQLGFFGAILAFAYFVWLQLALLLFMLFLGNKPLPPASEFIPTLLFTPHGLGLLVSGTVIGGALAFLVFAISAISVPLLMTRRLDAVTAIGASVAAVRLNPKAMMLWAALIAGFMALGIATLSVGLVIAFPLIGHATWHACRDLVRDRPGT